MSKNHQSQRGLTLIELLIAASLVLTAAMVLVNHITTSYRNADATKDRVFAYSKAQAILAEMHSLVESTDDAVAKDLDVLDDGVIFNPTLSISQDAGKLVAPDHPISGNLQRKSEWLWSRRIEVRPFAGLNNRNVRYVTVHVYRRNIRGRQQEIATLSSVINSLGDAFPTTQVFDVFLLAIESIPGWWVYMENIIPSVEAAITDIEARNPGLSLRTHWITKAGFGRDELYTPFTNEVNDSHTPVDSVYYYPGAMPSGNSSNYYYVPSMMTGHINKDGTKVNGFDAVTNPIPYAISDFYNHAMRLPRARAKHEARVAAIEAREAAIVSAKAGGTSPPAELADMSKEPPLQLLLEDMASSPDKYRHALVMNLHGELIPMPTVRNYSDAAKDPANLPGVRVVTHPEQLRTHRDAAVPANSEDVHLRVYAWNTNPGTYVGPEVLEVSKSIRLKIMDVDLTNGGINTLQPGVKIKNLRGGVPVDGSSEYSTLGLTDPTLPESKFFGDPALKFHEMCCYVAFVNPGAGHRKYTLIYLINTPVSAPYVETAGTGQWRGLNNTTRSRLYGMEYIPSPTRDRDFSRDLSTPGDGPKNTARWRITIPKTILTTSRFVNPDTASYGNPDADVALTVQTHILDTAIEFWTQLAYSGNVFGGLVSPGNFSETYTWWAESRDAVPFTERAQFLGDPRHNPYRDLLHGDPDFGDGYNWFFDGLSNDVAGSTGDFPGIERRFNRWEGSMRQDVPRFFELYRNALINSESIYTTLTGYSYYYMGHGNEIGYDSANGYRSSIPTHLRPFGNASATGHVNNITGYRRYVRSVDGGSSFWWGLPWLGELCPDQAWATYVASGNLPAGTATGEFYRYKDQDCHDNSSLYQAYDTSFDRAHQRTASKGCVSFMNNGTSSQHFNHHFAGGSAGLVGPGQEMANNYNFVLPAAVSSNRPFSVDTGGNNPPEQGLAPYSTTRATAVLSREYYKHGTESGSGLVTLSNAGNTAAANIVVNGLNPTTSLGSTFIAKLSVIAMLQSYFELGKTGTAHRIAQPPRVTILAPTDVTELNDPSAVTLQWSTAWQRWDGRKYTESTANNFVEAESDIEYALLYSKDHGKTWFHVVDDSVATPGRKPVAAMMVADAKTGQESYSWSLPDGSFPKGVYLLRIEAYRKGQTLHYSQHMMRFFVDR